MLQNIKKRNHRQDNAVIYGVTARKSGDFSFDFIKRDNNNQVRWIPLR